MDILWTMICSGIVYLSIKQCYIHGSQSWIHERFITASGIVRYHRLLNVNRIHQNDETNFYNLKFNVGTVKG